MSPRWWRWCLVASMLAAMPVHAQTPSPQEPARVRGAAADGIGGIVANQTISAAGYEFYRIFTELWREKPDSENYFLSIVEKPSKRYGNRVWVFLGQKWVYSGALPIKQDRIRPLCEQAVEESLANVVVLTMQQFSGDSDLGRDEL